MIKPLRSVLLPGSMITALLMSGSSLAQSAGPGSDKTARQNDPLEISITGEGMLSNTIGGAIVLDGRRQRGTGRGVLSWPGYGG